MSPPPSDRGERWKPAARGFPDYVVSDLGRLFNTRTGRLLRPHLNDPARGSPYWRVGLSNGAFTRGPRKGRPRRRWFYVHRLVALAFVEGRTRHRWQVDHKNFDTTDARAVNLQWLSRQENLARRRFPELVYEDDPF